MERVENAESETCQLGHILFEKGKKAARAKMESQEMLPGGYLERATASSAGLAAPWPKMGIIWESSGRAIVLGQCRHSRAR